MSDHVNYNANIFDPSCFIFPVNPALIFKNSNSSALEIGFGEGEFILDISSKNPNKNYIGIEIKTGRFKKAVRKAGKQCLNNLKLLNIEASIAINQIFSKNSFDTVYINFPDPWPKNRHSKHRLFNQSFIECLSKILRNSGTVRVKTDHNKYLIKIINEFENSSLFYNNFFKSGFIKDKRSDFETKFEKEFKEIGKEIFFTTFTNLSD